MLSITPFLWFDTQAEQAMRFYASVFPRAREVAVQRAGDTVISVTFELEGQRFMGLNAGPQFRFNEAVSFFVGCESQQEIDALWTKLLANGGTESRCGWLKDQFGLSWQIIPNVLGSLLGHPDREKANRAMQAMFGMQKLDIAALQRAFDGA
jgi:predicted 3-demethylubiquinone-9 3-methyltransferase (glyoxalase superfamily)